MRSKRPGDHRQPRGVSISSQHTGHPCRPDTTGFSRVECQLLRNTPNIRAGQTPPASAAWSVNFLASLVVSQSIDTTGFSLVELQLLR